MSPSVAFNSLPLELIDNICHHSTTSDLLAFAQTNSVLHTITQRILYRHIDLSSFARNLHVVITLARKPHLAHHVRSFSIRVMDPFSTVFHSYYRHLAKALSGMTELVSLDIFLDPSATWVLQGPCGSTFPRLQRFATSFPFDSHVASFLNSTGDLRALTLDSVPDQLAPPPLPISSLPLLSQFTGPVHAAAVIVPGRPVETIHLTEGDLTEDVVEGLAQSTAHVAILNASTSSLPVPLLGYLAHFMPHLVYLQMQTTYSFSEAPDVAFYANVSQALTFLPKLDVFVLSGMNWSSSRKNDRSEGRIWQSKPLSNAFDAQDDDDDVDLYSDVFFAY